LSPCPEKNVEGECGYSVTVKKVPEDNETTMRIKISLTLSNHQKDNSNKTNFDMITMDNTNTESTTKKTTMTTPLPEMNMTMQTQ